MSASVMASLAELAKKAADPAHRFTLDKLKQVIAGDAPPAGYYPDLVVEVPIGMRVVLCEEEQPKKGGGTGWLRHASFSVGDGGVPSVMAVMLLLPMLGFKSELSKCIVFMDPDETVVNILEPIGDEDPSPAALTSWMASDLAIDEKDAAHLFSGMSDVDKQSLVTRYLKDCVGGKMG